MPAGRSCAAIAEAGDKAELLSLQLAALLFAAMGLAALFMPS